MGRSRLAQFLRIADSVMLFSRTIGDRPDTHSPVAEAPDRSRHDEDDRRDGRLSRYAYGLSCFSNLLVSIRLEHSRAMAVKSIDDKDLKNYLCIFQTDDDRDKVGLDKQDPTLCRKKISNFKF